MNAGLSPARRVNLVQGEFRVSDDPDVTLTTILGSCVGACIRDPIRGVGGMNHFLLPGADIVGGSIESERMGVRLMELLMNGLMREGARRDRLEAKIFGGARMMRGLSDIGQKNAEFARSFLRREGIRVVGGDVGGDRGRRLHFWPVSGRARQCYLGHFVEPLARDPFTVAHRGGPGDADSF
jgi:chemotaxis protein CheD